MEIIKHYDELGNMADDYSRFYIDGELIAEVVNSCLTPRIGESIRFSGECLKVVEITHNIRTRIIEYHLTQ